MFRGFLLAITILITSVSAYAQVQSQPMGNGTNLTGIACRVNETQTTLASENAANFCTTDTKGNTLVSLQSGTSSATNPIKLEDSAHASGDASLSVLGVRRDSPTVLTSTDGDYANIELNGYGAAYAEINLAGQSSTANGILKPEDGAAASGDAGVAVFGRLQSALTVDAADGDYGLPKFGLDGRQITSLASAGEMFSSCSAAITGTSRTAIKTAVASNRHYVTSITCSNNSAVNTQASFTDGAGAQLAAGNITALGGIGFAASFPVPLRGSVNTDVSVTLTTTATNTICCANGYISVN